MSQIISRRAMMVPPTGGGETGMKITSYTLPRGSSFQDAVNAANIPLIAENEVLIWNVRGTTKQSIGSVGAKMGITVVQNGSVIANASGYKRSTSIVAPDSMKPASSWTASTMSVINGHYHADSPLFFVGAGNTFDFVQIPYNIGWNTEA